MRPPLPTLALIALCTLAGFAASWIGLPLPFMIGPLLASGLLSTVAAQHMPARFAWLTGLRLIFIAVIGLMIGTQITPALLSQAHGLALGFLAIGVFVVAATGYNYLVFRCLGRFDVATAFYSSAPGGLYESIAFGEEAGADASRLVLQQFLRVITVVTLLPVGLSFWHGAPLGSAAGMSMANAHVPLSHLPLVAVAVAAGIGLGQVVRLPARQLTAPMAVGAVLSLSGLVQMDIPQWLVNLAQIVVGASLGTRFSGNTGAKLVQGAALALVSVGGMLCLAVAMASLLALATGEAFDVLLISFAPGGVTEMALVALSLPANPALVTLYHIVRIVITVLGLSLSAGWLKRQL